jgi:hypothetical protein
LDSESTAATAPGRLVRAAVVGLQRSVRKWAMRQGWGGRRVEPKEARGILVAALGMLASHLGYRMVA